jgi:hypothetical protein
MQEFARMRRVRTWLFGDRALRKAAITLGVLGVLSLSGCGDGKVRRYPVTGIVKVDGQPAEGATIIFCPVNGPPEVMRERPFSQTDSSGHYELKTLEPGDGAPVGEYKVTIRWMSWPKNNSAELDRDRGGGGQGFDRLGNRYWDLDKTPLTAKVDKGKNEIPFDLSSKGK